jgi:hypothetical protein
MQLNEKQVYAVQRYLQGIPDTKCVLCQQQEWKVSETVFALPEYQRPNPATYFGLGGASSFDPTKDQHVAGGSFFRKAEPEVFPVIPIVCGRCGFVFFLSAVAAGVVKR